MTAPELVTALLAGFGTGAGLQLFAQLIRRGRSS